MVGLDDEWKVYMPYNSDGLIDGNGLLRLPLMGMKPGHYEVEVQASMSPDDWDTRPYVWTIDIHEPWWRATAVFMAFGGVLAVLLLINVFYYMKNANLKAQRNSEENMLIKRIYAFVERCESKTEILEPEDYATSDAVTQNTLDPAFVKAMEKVKPLVTTYKIKKMTMRRLSNAAGINAKDFYQLLTANIFKSPRALIKKARLEEAEKMLRNTKAPIEDVAARCGFVSANYFIASFYQKHKVTPEKYRQKR